MRGTRQTTALLAILVTLVVIWPSCAKKKEKRPAAEEVVTVIIDGDTFILSSEKTVRIAMIDTPESGDPYAAKAESLLSHLVLGKKVALAPLGLGLDRYGRTLAEVFVDSMNIGKTLLDSGLALLYLYPDNIRLKNAYLGSQQLAIQRAIGIWSLPAPVPEKCYFNVKGSYRFHRPLCFHLKKTDPHRLVRIDTRLDALRQGLSPCRSCQP